MRNGGSTCIISSSIKKKNLADLCQLQSGSFASYVQSKVDRIWCRRGSYYNIPQTKFYLLKGDYTPKFEAARVYPGPLEVLLTP